MQVNILKSGTRRLAGTGFLFAGLCMVITALVVPVRNANSACNSELGESYELSIEAVTSPPENPCFVSICSTVNFAGTFISIPAGITSGSLDWSEGSNVPYSFAGVYTNWGYKTNVGTGAYPGSCSAGVAVVVCAVEVASISTNSSVTNAWPIYVGTNTTLAFYAAPNPAVGWPANKPVWGGVASGTGATVSVMFTNIGTNYVTAECGNVKTATVIGINVDIDANGGPLTNGDCFCIGEYVTLEATVQPTSMVGAATYSWTVPGTYTLQVGDALTNRIIHLWWHESESNVTLSVSAAWSGITCSADRQIDICSPRILAFEGTEEQTPGIYDNVPIAGDYSLSYGDRVWDGTNYNGGIDIRLEVETPCCCSGQLRYDQIVTSSRTRIHNGTNECLSFAGARDLFCPGYKTAPACTNVLWPMPGVAENLGDSPGQLLNSPADLTQVTISDSFVDYLDFKPDGTNSIWVPLGKLEWNWEGTANKGSGSGASAWSATNINTSGNVTWTTNSTPSPCSTNTVMDYNWQVCP